MSDKPSIMVQRRGDFLIPEAPVDGERIREFAAGKALRIDVRQPRRSNPQLRLYWSMLRLVAENLDQNVKDTDLHEWLKLKLGYVTPIKQRNGEIVEVPRSIAFDKMEQPEFSAYFEAVKALLTGVLIPGLKSDALEREANAMLGIAA